jgi:hypothetical protein
MPRCRSLLLVAVNAVLFGCSWSTDFVIANRSAESFDLVVAVRRGHYEGTTKPRCEWPYYELKALSLCDLGHSDRWVRVPEETLHRDEETCTVSVSIEPGAAIAIASLGTYAGHWESVPDVDPLHVQAVTLRTPDGVISYSGRELLKRFTRYSDFVYVLSYRHNPSRSCWRFWEWGSI